MTTTNQPNLLYVDEHLSCRYYKTDLSTGFRYLELDQDQEFRCENQDNHYLLFFIEGEFTLTSGSNVNCTFEGGQMIVIPKSTDFVGHANCSSKMVVFGFEHPRNNCDKLVLQSYAELCQQMDYQFEPTNIRYPITTFLELLVFCLENKMNCTHLHEMKQNELFLYLRGFYTKEELARLFYPIIGRSLDFRDFILANYRKANNITKLIELSNISRSSFFAKFKTEFGMSAKKWLDKQLMQDIMYLASDPTLSVKEIMYRTGFDNSTQFNRFCRSQSGQTASEIVQQIRGI